MSQAGKEARKGALLSSNLTMSYRSKCLAVFSCLLCLQWPARAQSNPDLRADELVRLAAQYNDVFLARKQQIIQAGGSLVESALRPPPRASIAIGSGRVVNSPGYDEGIADFTYTFETAGKRQKRMSVAEIGVDIARSDLAEAYRLLAFDVKAQYGAAAAERVKLNEIQRLLEITTQDVNITTQRVNEGDAPRLAQQLLTVESNRVRADQEGRQGNYQSAVLTLSRTLGIDIPAGRSLSVALDRQPQTMIVEELQNIAMRKRPDLIRLRLQREQASRDLILAEANGRPNVDAFLRYSYNYNKYPGLFALSPNGSPASLTQANHFLTTGISMQLFTKKRAEGPMQIATSRQEQYRLELDHEERSVKLEVAAALRRVQTTQQALDTLRTGVVAQADSNLQVVREAFRLGQLRVVDVLVEQRRLIDIRLSYVDTALQHFLAVCELERATGVDVP